MQEQKFPKVKGKVCRLLPYSLKFLAQQKKELAEGLENSLVYVKGFLTAKWTHQDLYDAFKKFGEIGSAKVSIDKEHNSKGYGYVQFTNSQSAKDAIAEVITQILNVNVFKYRWMAQKSQMISLLYW